MIDIYPTIATQRSLARQVAQIRRDHAEIATVICFGVYEDSLVFYDSDRDIVLFNVEQLDEIRAYLQAHGHVLILSQGDYIPSLQRHLDGSITLEEQPHSRGKLYLASATAPTNGLQKVSADRVEESRR